MVLCSTARQSGANCLSFPTATPGYPESPPPTASSHQPSLLKAEIPFAGDDGVIHHAQAKELTHLGQLLVCAQVGVAQLGVAGRMIVGKDDRSGPVSDDVGVDLARMDGAMVELPHETGSQAAVWDCAERRRCQWPQPERQSHPGWLPTPRRICAPC